MRNALLWNRNKNKNGSRNWLNSAKKFWVENSSGTGTSVYIEDIGYSDPIWVVTAQESFLTFPKEKRRFVWQHKNDIFNDKNISFTTFCMCPSDKDDPIIIGYSTKTKALNAYLKWMKQ